MSLEPLREELHSIRQSYAKDDVSREKIISLSRELIKFAKKAIFSMHRKDGDEAKELLEQAKKKISEIKHILEQTQFRDIGNFRAAMEEYVEASCFVDFCTNRTIPSRKQLNDVQYEIYLAALCDFSGELIRKAVSAATENDRESVIEIKNMIEEMYNLFLQFDFRSGELRKKLDSLKYNMAKIQSIMYDIHMKK